ncbi:MAG: tetraacyldisaccharide 4'-kinase [Bacteroidia bacterium]|nr:tetraacyldisaccharide 4'-kinase [Bacteroidia bacterium]
MNNKRNIFYNLVLLPLSLIYSLFIYIRNRLFDYNILRSEEFDIPVISIGNIHVGGTGKTPHVEYITSLLKKDFKLGVLSRGYKRLTRGFVSATSESTVSDIGDEPRQIRQKFPDIDLAVDGNRVRGINTLLDMNDSLDVILLDDAYQHRYVKPGISILLIDYHYPLYSDYMLPFGRLRESSSEKRRANIIIITKSPEEIKPIEKRILIKNVRPYPYQTLYFTSLRYSQPLPVFENGFTPPVFEDLKTGNCSVLLVTGIARPAPLTEFLGRYCKNITHMLFPDHHAYTKSELTSIASKFESLTLGKKIILTTEKDAMRFRDLKYKEIIELLPVFYIPVSIYFLHDEQNNFDNQIIDYVKKNKRHRTLYHKKNR